MQRRRWALAVLLGALATSLSVASMDLHAQPKRAAPRAAKKPARKAAPAVKPNKEVRAPEDEDVDEPERAGTSVADPASGGQSGPRVLEVKQQGDAGVKTYKFGPVEVEGRLKSPQIVYFLRRVRAEFAAGALGHRSFMGELSDTRRSPALK
ncbi:MAG TPA: hypothetical protein VK524_32785 [Polyangiaceae bacterium]|nr:hypothetical protein [Polyangiaceae bacterium]